jgi:hypothetical protein
MNPGRLIPTVVVIVVGIIAVGVIVSANPDMPSASADEPLTAEESNTAKKSDGGFSPYVDEDGNISLPKGYKQKWAHLGSWAVAKKTGETIHEMHEVYTPAETIATYNKTGEFPDGAVLVKEVLKTKADRLTTGHAAWATDTKIWFVMIKDRKQRFTDNDHWGDGWGWALFEAKDPTKNVSAGYDTSCIDCHVPVEESDWVYVYGYSDLKKPNK